VPGQTLTAEAFVIEKRPPAEAFRTFVLFSAEHGNLHALQRVSRRAAAQQPVPDLFDEVSAMLESSNQGRTWFFREVRINTRRASIGRSYDALRFACALAAVIGRNPVHEESRENVALLLRTALDAFGAADRPDIVYLKSLYLFAKDEGYPVRQEWLPSLGAQDRAVASAVLNLPLGQHASDAAAVAGIRRSLEGYLGSSTDIIIP
jgi:recombinational DNA repair protein (RecF pathway)